MTNIELYINSGGQELLPTTDLAEYLSTGSKEHLCVGCFPLQSLAGHNTLAYRGMTFNICEDCNWTLSLNSNVFGRPYNLDKGIESFLLTGKFPDKWKALSQRNENMCIFTGQAVPDHDVDAHFVYDPVGADDIGGHYRVSGQVASRLNYSESDLLGITGRTDECAECHSAYPITQEEYEIRDSQNRYPKRYICPRCWNDFYGRKDDIRSLFILCKGCNTTQSLDKMSYGVALSLRSKSIYENFRCSDCHFKTVVKDGKFFSEDMLILPDDFPGYYIYLWLPIERKPNEKKCWHIEIGNIDTAKAVLPMHTRKYRPLFSTYYDKSLMAETSRTEATFRALDILDKIDRKR